MKNRKLQINIEKSEIVIRLPISVMENAAAYTFMEHTGEPEESPSVPKICNAKLFAKEVVQAIEAENEIGQSMLTNMFDAAFIKAMADGAQGLIYKEQEPRP